MSQCPHASRLSKEQAIYGVFYVGPEPPDQYVDSSDSDYDFGYSKEQGKNLSDQEEAFISGNAQKEEEEEGPKFRVVEAEVDENKEEQKGEEVPISRKLKREQKALEKGFEKKYTKGLKMFKKWGGTVGKGMGKDEQGMVAPLLGVEASAGGGLGYKDVKKKATDMRQNERLIKFSEKLANKTEEKQDESEEQQAVPFYAKGMKSGTQTFEKGISMKEFREKILRGEKSTNFQNIKVVDLAGNECTISQGIQKEDVRQAYDEDQVNLRKSQIELQALFHRKDYHTTRRLQIEQEISHVENEKQEQLKKAQKIKIFQEQVQKVLEGLKKKENMSALERIEWPRFLISEFSRLAEINAQLFRQFRLNGILMKELISFLKQDYRSQWDVEKDLAYNFDVYSELRTHLQCCDYQNRALGQEEEDEGIFFGKHVSSSEHDILYLRIVFEEIWMNAVRLYFRKEWGYREASDLPGRLFLTWKSILPANVIKLYSDIFDQVFSEQPQIMLANYPHLVSASQLQLCFEEKVSFEIKRELRKRSWHRSHDQLCERLVKWKKVVSEECFSNFKLKGLMPRVGALVQQMEINPSDQDISPLQVLFYFVKKGVFTAEEAFSVLKNHFFSRWLIVLEKWSKQGSKVKREIGQWFRGWRGFLTDEMGRDSHLVFYFRLGLFIIHKNIELTTL